MSETTENQETKKLTTKEAEAAWLAHLDYTYETLKNTDFIAEQFPEVSKTLQVLGNLRAVMRGEKEIECFLNIDFKFADESEHEANKTLRQALAHAHFLLTHQVRHKPADFMQAASTIATIANVCMDLQAKIEEVEPPAPKAQAPKKPYVIDATKGVQ